MTRNESFRLLIDDLFPKTEPPPPGYVYGLPDAFGHRPLVRVSTVRLVREPSGDPTQAKVYEVKW